MQTKPEIVALSAKSRIGHPYVFGAWGESCTPANRKRRARADHPTIKSKCQVLSGKKTTCDGCKYQGMCIYDCRGFTHRCLLDAGIDIYGEGATTQWNTKSNWLATGTTDCLPDCVCCIFKDKGGTKTHTGLHIDGGDIVHCSGEVKTGKIDKSWTHWGIPAGLYDAVPEGRIIVMSTLKLGSKGENVMALQKNLYALGYDPGSFDGKFGQNTLAAVKRFQKDYGLKVDGLVGTMTQAAITDALNRKPGAGEGNEGSADVVLFVASGGTAEERIAAIEDYLTAWSARLRG